MNQPNSYHSQAPGQEDNQYRNRLQTGYRLCQWLHSGRFSDTINSSGSIVINWGSGIDPYRFIVAPAIKITVGVVIRQIKVPETEENKSD
ncbi:hypothetical protein MUO98_05260 [Candidatus Bathyarchaeota archaeon]|nr:hypothetical protein [Candidatus Bathyarchaeota archaeon]